MSEHETTPPDPAEVEKTKAAARGQQTAAWLVELRAWMGGMSEHTKATCMRNRCVTANCARRVGKDGFLRDPLASAKDIAEIEAAIGTWTPDPPKPLSEADETGGSWKHTNPPKKGKRAKSSWFK